MKGLLIVFVTLFVSSYAISLGVNESLYEPDLIDLTADGSSVILYSRLCAHSISDQGMVYVNMTRYCYCTDSSDDDSCSFPGPTLIMSPYTSINVTISNQLTGSSTVYESSDDEWNTYKDMDTTNFHTHGAHVDPQVDDALLSIKPGESLSFSYVIDYHYPGTHWYHAHHHGSTTWQVNMGFAGALIMQSDDDSTDKYEENILLFNWVYAVPSDECDCSDDTYFGFAACDVYCAFPSAQTSASGYTYDVQTELSYSSSNLFDDDAYASDLLLLLTNGQISPVIDDMEVGVYRRLRLINALADFYLQIKFPSDCDSYLIATDGIYLNNDIMNYDLSDSSHNNYLLISAGGRADVMIKCDSTGLYSIKSSQNNGVDDTLSDLERFPSDYVLAWLLVSDTNMTANEINGTDELPSSYPSKPTGSYVEDTLSESDEIDTCSCNSEGGDENFDDGDCYFSFKGADGEELVNDKAFSIDHDDDYPYLADSMYQILYDELYEFQINNGRGAHIYHQHINPFQVQDDVGDNGFIAMEGMWFDTLGNLGESGMGPDSETDFVKIRFWTRDYKGLVILHCHLLNHEDKGMMAFYNIVDELDCITTTKEADSASQIIYVFSVLLSLMFCFVVY